MIPIRDGARLIASDAHSFDDTAADLVEGWANGEVDNWRGFQAATGLLDWLARRVVPPALSWEAATSSPRIPEPGGDRAELVRRLAAARNAIDTVRDGGPIAEAGPALFELVLVLAGVLPHQLDELRKSG